VFARPACRCFIPFLPKYHILSGEPSDFYEKLSGCRTLNAPVKQSAFATAAALGLAWRRAEFLFASFLTPAVLASSFFGGQVEVVIFHLILHSE